MFSHASVSHSVGGGRYFWSHVPSGGVGYPGGVGYGRVGSIKVDGTHPTGILFVQIVSKIESHLLKVMHETESKSKL